MGASLRIGKKVGLDPFRLFFVEYAPRTLVEVFELTVTMGPIQSQGRSQKKKRGKGEDDGDVSGPLHQWLTFLLPRGFGGGVSQFAYDQIHGAFHGNANHSLRLILPSIA